jgi:succinate-acetate transporter protein
MFITGILQFVAGVIEIAKGNATLGLVYMAYGFSACALSTI